MINSDHPVADAARVAPRLWIGSHPPIYGVSCCGDHPTGKDKVDLKHGGFDYLVLCAEEYQPGPEHFPGVEVHYAPFDDDSRGLDKRQLDIAINAAEQTVLAHQQGKRCLVTCMAGRNRSGIVTALALSALSGMTPAQACERVRAKRGLAALTNPWFRGFLNRVEVKFNNPRARDKPCDLCKAEPITRRYHEDAICWIADCVQCNVPMAVYREHGALPPRQHMEHMIELLKLCARPGQRYVIDDAMETIPDHYHAHLRPVVDARKNPDSGGLHVVCAWCKKVIQRRVKGAPVSHGICEPCLEKQRLELQKLKQRKRKK